MKHVSKTALLGSAAIMLTRKGEDEEPVAIVTKALADLQKSVDDRLKAVETKSAAIETKADTTKLTERLDKIEAKVNRPGNQDDDKPDDTVERKAWIDYIRQGQRTPADEIKVLTVANDVSAGYLAPAEVSREFIDDLTEVSPIRQYATVRQSLAPSVKYPGRGTGTNAKWEGEIEEAEESTLTFRQTEIVSHRLTTFVELSNSLLMGSDGMAEAEVKRAFADDFAIKEGRAFISGSGIKEPQGIMTAPGVPTVLNGHATVLSPDALISLMYALPAQYRARGVWIMNGLSVAVARKMKDGQGQYIWQPGLQAGQPATLLGRPIVEAPDMATPTSDAFTANTFPIAFGDLATAYRIVDRQQLATLSDPYRKAEFAVTRIYGTAWVGAGVVQPAAIRKLKMATS